MVEDKRVRGGDGLEKEEGEEEAEHEESLRQRGTKSVVGSW
jgi:hypothetical protein